MKYEIITKTSYPPILKKGDQETVLTTQTEIVLCGMILDLMSRVELLEKRSLLSKAPGIACKAKLTTD